MLLERTITKETFEGSCRIIPGGVNSPVRAFKEVDILPLIVERGLGDTIVDIDGNAYIDYCMSFGALMLGHAHQKVVSSVQKQVQEGSSFGICTLLEKKIAEKIVGHMPSMEKIRFVSSGTEATMSALRLARGFTGRNRLIKFDGNYHGHADPFLVRAGSGVADLPMSSSLGIPQEVSAHTISLPYNDIDALKAVFARYDDIAAVIIEPVAANMGLVLPEIGFLEAVSRETKEAGALLIFDEVVTGFRVGLGGMQQETKIVPDLTCLGKIIGGGLPAAAFGGRAEIMDLLAPSGKVYQAGTLSGNPLALAAGLATLEEIEQPGFYQQLEARTADFLAPIRQCIEEKGIKAVIQSKGSMFTIFFGVDKVQRQEDLQGLDSGEFKRFYAYLLEQGIYFPPSPQEVCFISAAHTLKSLAETQRAILQFFV